MSIKSFFLLISVPILYGFLSVLIKKATTNIPPFASISISMFVLSVCAMGFSLVFEKEFVWSFKENQQNLRNLIYVGLFNLLCFWFLIKALHEAEVWKQQLFETVKPVFAGLFGIYILSESFSKNLIFGLGVIVVGMFIALKN